MAGEGQRIVCIQCGRDPAEEPNRIGRIANIAGIRWACENGFAMLDYLRGDEAYKSQLRATPIASHRVRIVARAGAAELRHNIWLACRQLKSRWEQLRAAPAASGAVAASDSSAGEEVGMQ